MNERGVEGKGRSFLRLEFGMKKEIGDGEFPNTCSNGFARGGEGMGVPELGTGFEGDK